MDNKIRILYSDGSRVVIGETEPGETILEWAGRQRRLVDQEYQELKDKCRGLGLEKLFGE